MASYARFLLSGSTNGRPIPVVAVATPGTLVHTAVAGTTSFEEVYLWASNQTGAAAKLTVEWGGVATGDHLVTELSVPAHSEAIPVAVGQTLNGGVEVRAYSDAASAINITGNVNRITP